MLTNYAVYNSALFAIVAAVVVVIVEAAAGVVVVVVFVLVLISFILDAIRSVYYSVGVGNI